MISELREQLDSKGRHILVNVAYSWLVSVALMLSGFSAFPDFKWPFAFAVIFISLGFQGVASFVDLASTRQNALADLAERKTRWTIVMAAERLRLGESADDLYFWGNVDERVKDEIDAQNEDGKNPAGCWKSIGLVTANLAGRLALDLLAIGLAAVLTTN